MATMLRLPRLRTPGLGFCLGLSLAALQQNREKPLRLDPLTSTPIYPSKGTPRTSLFQYGKFNPGALKQISSGSLLGLCAGLAISTFSRPLTIFFGFLIVGVQWASSYGINVLPYKQLQRYVTGLDLKSALQENVAFKLSFGTSFVMAAFLEF